MYVLIEKKIKKDDSTIVASGNIQRNISETCQGNPILSPICNSHKRLIASAASLSSGFQLIAWVI